MEIPVSMIATSASTRASSPLIGGRGRGVATDPPDAIGMVCEASSITSSGTTATTFGSVSRAWRCAVSSLAVKPRKAREKLRCARVPSRLRCLSRTAAVSVPALSITRYRPVGVRSALWQVGWPPVGVGGRRRLDARVGDRRGVRFGCGLGRRAAPTARRSGSASGRRAGWVRALGSPEDRTAWAWRQAWARRRARRWAVRRGSTGGGDSHRPRQGADQRHGDDGGKGEAGKGTAHWALRIDGASEETARLDVRLARRTSSPVWQPRPTHP